MTVVVRILVRSELMAVWAAIIVVTGVSWFFGGGTGPHGVGAEILIIGLAFAKVAAVGWWFMEVKSAPSLLRGVFGTWVVGTAGALTALVALGF